MHSFSSFWQVIMILPCYINSIYIFCIFYRLWSWHFLNHFLFASSRIQNWWKMDQFGGKSKNKLNSAEFTEFVFFKSASNLWKVSSFSANFLKVFFYLRIGATSCTRRNIQFLPCPQKCQCVPRVFPNVLMFY